MIETRLQSNEPLASVIQISDPLSPCPLWTFSRYNINRQLQCRSAVVLMCRQFTELYPQYCPRCCIVTENKTFHCIYECLYSEVARATLWRNLIENCGCSFFLSVYDAVARAADVHSVWSGSECSWTLMSIWRQYLMWRYAFCIPLGLCTTCSSIPCRNVACVG